MTLLLADSLQASIDKLMPGKSHCYALVLVTRWGCPDSVDRSQVSTFVSVEAEMNCCS